MADIDNEKNKTSENADDTSSNQEETASASLRDLIASAGEALGGLEGEAVEAAPKKKSKKRKASKSESPEADVSWNASTEKLDFTEEGTNAIEELARRVAETVKHNEQEADIQEASNDVEAMEASAENAEVNDQEFEASAHEPANDIDPLEPAPLQAEPHVEAAEGIEHMPSTGVDEHVEASPETDPDMSGDQPMAQMGFHALEEELEAAENDADPEPTEFIETSQLISIIESMLFSTDKPVSVATIKALFKGTNIRTKDITRALDELASEYARPERGVTLEDVNGGFQLRTKSDNADFLRRLQKSRPFRLSGPALEVMAIVAYKQPVTKSEIDEIRGVESGHLLRALMERGLVNFEGKSDLPGKPMAYGTTRKFLETFGLRNLRELPTLSEIDELIPEGIGDVEEKETLSDITDSMAQSIAGTYSEGEDELEKINEQLKAVDTTSEFFEQEKVRERERRDRERAQDIREKLVLGDAVDTKDQRWLERYEAKLAMPAGEEPMAEATEAAIEEGPALSEQLENLTSESDASSEAAASSNEETSNDEEASEEDLNWADDADADDLSGDDWSGDTSDEDGEKEH